MFPEQARQPIVDVAEDGVEEELQLCDLFQPLPSEQPKLVPERAVYPSLGELGFVRGVALAIQIPLKTELVHLSRVAERQVHDWSRGNVCEAVDQVRTVVGVRTSCRKNEWETDDEIW